MPDPAISDFISRMAAAFVPEKATGIDTTIQFTLTGTQATAYFMTIKDAKCTVTQGTTPTAKLTVTTDSGDFIKIFTGQMDGMRAYMQGKFKVAGDMSVALKLLNLFKIK